MLSLLDKPQSLSSGKELIRYKCRKAAMLEGLVSRNIVWERLDGRLSHGSTGPLTHRKFTMQNVSTSYGLKRMNTRP